MVARQDLGDAAVGDAQLSTDVTRPGEPFSPVMYCADKAGQEVRAEDLGDTAVGDAQLTTDVTWPRE